MRAKDLKATKSAKVLVVGEDSNLQWSGKVPEFVMFADYFFRDFPKDGGERSRNVEARNLFAYIAYVTGNKFKPEELYFTNLCNDLVTMPPKGKRVLIPEEKAIRGMTHIEWILEENPTIQYVVVMSMQSNYWFQKLGFYPEDEVFINGAQPRRIGLNCENPFYQPVNGKVFRNMVANRFVSKKHGVTVIPVLSAREYPLKDKNLEIYGDVYELLHHYMMEE